MTFPKARLVVSACLFVGWLVFLFVLWLRSSSVILSHPQFMIAQVYAVVEIHDADGKPAPDVKVEEVLWPAEFVKKGPLNVVNLPMAGAEHGYGGAGRYLVPLIIRGPMGNVNFEVAPVPIGARQIRVYRWDEKVKSQVDEIIAAKQ